MAKLAVEKYLNYYYQIFGLNYSALRYSNVYGPRQDRAGEAGVVAIWSDRILKGEQPIINGDGEQTRDFVYVGDVVRANLLALADSQAKVYNVSTAKETRVKDLFELIRNNFNKPVKASQGNARAGELRRSCLSFDRIKKDFGWQPEVALDEGIKRTVEWFKDRESGIMN